MARGFEVQCEDFKSWKGCGKTVLMQKTGKIKDDGKPEWKKFELDGETLHTHDKPVNVPQQQTIPPNEVPKPDPAKQLPNTVVLEHQVAMLAVELDGLKQRVRTLEDKDIARDAAMLDADEDELGEEKAE